MAFLHAGDTMMRLKFWLLCLSIALNIFFVGTYMADRMPWSTTSRTGPAPVMPYESLDLSKEQQLVFDAERDRFHGQMMETRQSIRSKQDELIQLLFAEKPDHTVIYSKQQEILALQDKVQHDVIAHILDIRAPLSREQRDRFSALLRQRMAQQAPFNLPGCN
jgi:uncharacterized membrane protein